MLDEAMPSYESEFEAIRQVASKLGMSAEALRRWRRVSEVDSGARPGMSSEEHAELKRLKKENAELRRANEILRSASLFVAAELDRPTTR
jgi:transposase